MIEIMSIFLYQILAPFATESRISAKITQEEDFKNEFSTQFQSTNIDVGESEFLQKIKGHDISKVISVLDELMEALKALNPQLYANTLRRFE